MTCKWRKGAAIWGITILMLFCAWVPRATFADENTATISASASSVEPGKTFVVTVGFRSGVALLTAQMDVNYPSDLLELVTVERVDASAAGTGNPIKLTYESDAGGKSATLAKITFKVKNTMVGGQKATISITNAYGPDENFSKVTLSNASATVTAASAKSTDATLKSLAVDGQTLTPAFSSDVTGYQVNVANGATAVKVSAKANDSNAKVTVSGGSKLAVGENTVKVVVTAEAGNQNTYVIKVVRAAAEKPPVSSKSPVSSSALSSNAQLATLKLTDVNLPFSPTVREYAVKVPNEQKTVEIEATAKEKNAKINILVNNQKITDGVGELKVGANYVIVQVTAPDGTTTRSYNIVVTRESAKPSSQAPSSAPVSSRPVSSQGSSSESASSAEASSQMTSSETVTSVPSSSNPVSSETVSTESDSSAQSSVSSEGVQSVESEAETPSSPGDSSGNTFLDWLKKDRSDLALHAAYIGGMIICLLAGCMLGYYLRGRKKEK